MGGARALIASLGASISLVAGAALSLLVVSFVFAYHGFTGATDASRSPTALVLDAQAQASATSPGARSAGAAPVVIRATPAAASTPARRAAKPASPAVPETKGGGPRTPPAFTPRVSDIEPAIQTQAPVKTSTKPQTGDGVRGLGDAVSATVQGTGDAAGSATAPLLGPPVSKAVQDVLDLISSLLKGATGGLAGVLDKAVPVR